MKVKKLIEILSKFDENKEVILSRDSEGNGFSMLYQVTQEDIELDEDVIVLWPE